MAGFSLEGGAAKVTTWAARPFREDMDVIGWLLFLVFVVSVAFLWTRIIGQITELGVDE